MGGNYLLEMTHIVKTFPGVKALDDVQLYLRRGEIHALMGENGAGKSTLIKILTGVYKEDHGDIRINGKDVQIHSVVQAQNAGVNAVFQELNLIPYLSVAENIYIGKYPMDKSGGIDWKCLFENAQNLYALMNFVKDNLAALSQVKSYIDNNEEKAINSIFCETDHLVKIKEPTLKEKIKFISEF